LIGSQGVMKKDFFSFFLQSVKKTTWVNYYAKTFNGKKRILSNIIALIIVEMINKLLSKKY